MDKYYGPIRYILNGKSAKKYTGLARNYLSMAMKRMGEDDAYWIRRLPDRTEIIVSSIGGIKQVWITTQEELLTEADYDHGFYLTNNATGDLDLLELEENGGNYSFTALKEDDAYNGLYSVPFQNTGTTMEPNGSKWVGEENVLTASDTVIYRRGVQWSPIPNTDLSTITGIAGYTVDGVTQRVYIMGEYLQIIKCYSRTYTDDGYGTDDTLYDAATNPDGWKLEFQFISDYNDLYNDLSTNHYTSAKDGSGMVSFETVDEQTPQADPVNNFDRKFVYIQVTIDGSGATYAEHELPDEWNELHSIKHVLTGTAVDNYSSSGTWVWGCGNCSNPSDYSESIEGFSWPSLPGGSGQPACPGATCDPLMTIKAGTEVITNNSTWNVSTPSSQLERKCYQHAMYIGNDLVLGYLRARLDHSSYNTWTYSRDWETIGPFWVCDTQSLSQSEEYICHMNRELHYVAGNVEIPVYVHKMTHNQTISSSTSTCASPTGSNNTTKLVSEYVTGKFNVDWQNGMIQSWKQTGSNATDSLYEVHNILNGLVIYSDTLTNSYISENSGTVWNNEDPDARRALTEFNGYIVAGGDYGDRSTWSHLTNNPGFGSPSSTGTSNAECPGGTITSNIVIYGIGPSYWPNHRFRRTIKDQWYLYTETATASSRSHTLSNGTDPSSSPMLNFASDFTLNILEPY